MSEFPEWVERQLGWSELTPEEGCQIHKEIEVVRKWVPDIDERLRVAPDKKWSFWRQLLWYLQH